MRSVDDFKAALLAAHVLTAEQWQTFWDGLPADGRPTEAEPLADLLLQKDLLTPFQARKLIDDRGSELVVQDFVILDPQKAGAKGAVFRARHVPTGNLVSLKVLGGKFKTPKALARIERESKAVSLPHRNLVQIVGSGEYEGCLFLATECLEGSDLRQVLKARGQFSVEHALDYSIQAARGLGHAHQKGHIHRDIQPCNLFLTDDGCVKVMNLGTTGENKDSRGVPIEISLEDPDDEVVGTVDYMSPEQAEDWRQADARSDVYSLGCTLYRLLTTHRPYRGHDEADKIKAHREHPIPSLRAYRPGAPRALDALLHKAMAKRPADRYASMGEFAAAMEKYLAQTSGSGELEAADDPSGLMPSAVPTIRNTPPPESLPPAYPPPLAAMPPQAAPGYGAPMAAQPYSSGVVSAAAVMSPPPPPGMASYSPAYSQAPAPVLPPLPSDPDATPIGRRKRFNLGRALGTLFVLGVTIALNVGVYYAFVVYGGPQYDYLNIMQPPTVEAQVDAKRAAMLQSAWARHLRVPNSAENTVGVDMLMIPPGEYLRGSDDGDADADETEKPQRRVQITKPFFLSRHEITQGQWRKLLGTAPWNETPNVQEGDTYPALNVSYEDALEFCRVLSEKEGEVYRLPTEAEWEYACRAGTTTRYSFGDDVDAMHEYAWYAPPGKKPTSLAQSVGAKNGNAFSLHDMHGNVREWCQDWYLENYYSQAPEENPLGPETGSLRVLRGGAWDQAADLCRSAAREGQPADSAFASAGFRIVRELKKKP